MPEFELARVIQILVKRRTDLDLQQDWLAERLGISQSQLSRYEQQLAIPPADVLLNWFGTLGVSGADVFGSAVQEEGISASGAPYAQLTRHLDQLEHQVSGLFTPANPFRQQFVTRLASLRMKPNVVIAGAFDSGKSTIASSILDLASEGGLPSRIGRTTRIMTYLRHADDTPAWIRNAEPHVRSAVAFVFGRGFDPTRWADGKHASEHLISAGPLSILTDHVVQGARYSGAATNALVFLDRPLLRACTLIDTPGYDGDPRDDASVDSLPFPIDVLIFTSPTYGFLKSSEFNRLTALLGRLSPVHRFDHDHPFHNNLFIVMTLAGPTLEDSRIHEVFNDRCASLYSHWSAALSASLNIEAPSVATIADPATQHLNIDEPSLRRSFYSFYRELPSRRQRFEDHLRVELFEKLPRAWGRRAVRSINEIVETASAEARDTVTLWKQLVDHQRRLADLHRKLTSGRSRETRSRKLEEVRSQMTAVIARTASDCGSEVKSLIARLVVRPLVEQMLERIPYEGADDPRRFALAGVCEIISRRVRERVQHRIRGLTGELESYVGRIDQLHLEDFGFSMPGDSDTKSEEKTRRGLDAWRIITTTVVTVLGFGAYRVAGADASLQQFLQQYASFSLSVPLSLFAGSMSGLLTWRITGADRNRRLAGKIVEALTEHRVAEGYANHVLLIFRHISDAFDAGLTSVQHRWAECLSEIESVSSSSESGQSLKAKIELARKHYDELRKLQLFVGEDVP